MFFVLFLHIFEFLHQKVEIMFLIANFWDFNCYSVEVLENNACPRHITTSGMHYFLTIQQLSLIIPYLKLFAPQFAK